MTCLPVSPKSHAPLFPLFISLHSPRKNQSPSLHCSVFSLYQNTWLKLPSTALCPFSSIKIFFLDVSALSETPGPEIHITPHTKRETEGTLVQRLFQGCSIFFACRDNSLYFCHILHFHSQRLCHVVGNIGKEKNCVIVIFCPLFREPSWGWREMRYHDRALYLRFAFLES